MRRRLASFHSEMVRALGNEQRIFFYSGQSLLSVLKSQHVTSRYILIRPVQRPRRRLSPTRFLCYLLFYVLALDLRSY